MGKVVTALNAPNKTQNFYPADDNWELEKLPLLASAAIAEGAALFIEIDSNTTTGNLKAGVTENASGGDFVGILAEPVVATDADYAVAGKEKGVWVPKHPYAEAYFKVGAGTFTLADVFKTVEIHSDSVSLAVDTAGKGARITGYISSTRGRCRFGMPWTETA